VEDRRINSPVPRRALLMAGCVAALGSAFPRTARAATALVLPAADATRRFSVLYKGGRIGTHSIAYSAATGDARIDTEINLVVKVAFVTAYAFSHRSRETWRDGRLMTLASDTVERGQTLHVEGAATPHGFRVVSEGRPVIASAVTLTSNSLWTPTVLQQETVVDAQHGGIIGLSVRKAADEQIDIGGRQVRATRYSLITPFVAGNVWYDMDNLWVGGEFEREGATIRYRLDA
jgi:hypothetical protein